MVCKSRLWIAGLFGKLVYHRIPRGRSRTFVSLAFFSFCGGASLRIVTCVLPSTATSAARELKMVLRFARLHWRPLVLAHALIVILIPWYGFAQTGAGAQPACRVESTDYKGWHAEQLSNQWVQLVVIPQNGGRLIQVTFAGHPYLFVNPKYAGKYFPPDGSGHWFNYGGDKIWLLPEGND